jgi:hypothetical protein
MTSSDGINWATRNQAQTNTWSSICWSPELGLFCAVSFDGTNRVMTSYGERYIPADTYNTAIAEIYSTNKGFLPPRMSRSQKESIVNPVEGLVLYDTNFRSLSYYNGIEWKNV